MQQMQVTMVYLRTKTDTDYQHLATTCFDPTLFLSLKRQSAPNPTYVSLLFYNLELFSCYLYLDYKNKLCIFNQLMFKCFYDNGISNYPSGVI